MKHVKDKRIKGDNQHDTSGLKSDSLKGLGQGTGMLNKRLFGLGQAQMDFFRQNRSIGVGPTYLNDHKGRSLSDPHRGSGPPLHKFKWALGRQFKGLAWQPPTKKIVSSAPPFNKKEICRNRFIPLDISSAQEEGMQEICPNKNLDFGESFRMETD